MLGFPEARQQHGPRVLAAVSGPRVHASEDEGMRGREPGSAGKTVVSVVLGGVWAYHHIPPKKPCFSWVLCVSMNM